MSESLAASISKDLHDAMGSASGELLRYYGKYQ
jgi:hypothetical protein